MKKNIFLTLSALPFLLPVVWRLIGQGLAEPVGLLSDGAVGLLVWLCVLLFPHWLRIPVALLWVLFQITALELFAAMLRFPSWQDMHYLFDPEFMKNSTAGLNFAAPVKEGAMALALLLLCFFPAPRPRWRFLATLMLVTGLLFTSHAILNRQYAAGSIASRLNPLHWFTNDVVATLFREPAAPLSEADLPEGLRRLDLAGTRLIGPGKAKNVLIVVLEGIPGLYHSEIRQAMGVDGKALVMEGLVASTTRAMLIPDFVAHSAQTIRGLYAILCGDFSKLSYKTPKAFELTAGSERAANCLPAWLAAHGWETHYLQGAGLTFMSKDRVMPLIGFQHVHGSEWFTEPDPYPFEWGISDPAFFAGARRYIADLKTKGAPWMLTLLTVGTHHPCAPAPAEISRNYPIRLDAAVMTLDLAVAGFLKGIAADGVLDDTLVIVTSDESHGSEIADWVSSWGTAIVMAPEQDQLPRLKKGTFGLVDISASIIDYLDIPQPPLIVGRSFFRDYSEPREMVSFTANKLRWHSHDNLRYECGVDSDACQVTKADSILGFPTGSFSPYTEHDAAYFSARAAVLDDKLIAGDQPQLMRFANGEIRQLPEKIGNEWAENLIGAQYLDFPKNSKVHVSMRIKAMEAGNGGIRLKLHLRQFEYLITSISYPSFPLLHAGEVAEIAFDFDNPEPRQAFSFHLFGEGEKAAVRIEEFNVTVHRQGG